MKTLCGVLLFCVLAVVGATFHSRSRSSYNSAPRRDADEGEDAALRCNLLTDPTMSAHRRMRLQTQCDLMQYGRVNLTEAGSCTIVNLLRCYRDILTFFNVTRVVELEQHFRLNPMIPGFNIQTRCNQLQNLNPNNNLICVMNAKRDCPPYSSLNILLRRNDVNKLINFQTNFCFGCPDAVNQIARLREVGTENRQAEKQIYKSKLKNHNFDASTLCRDIDNNLREILTYRESCPGLMQSVNSTVKAMVTSFKLRDACDLSHFRQQPEETPSVAMDMDNNTLANQTQNNQTQETEIETTAAQNDTETSSEETPENVNVNPNAIAKRRHNFDYTDMYDDTVVMASSGTKISGLTTLILGMAWLQLMKRN